MHYRQGVPLPSAGCEIARHSDSVHHWHHAPAAGRPQHEDHWSGNKTAWNISLPPLPDIGGYPELWDELCAVKLDLDQSVPPRHQRSTSESPLLPRQSGEGPFAIETGKSDGRRERTCRAE